MLDYRFQRRCHARGTGPQTPLAAKETLGSSGSYRTTEGEILASFPTHGAFVTRYQGLSLVRESCHRLNEQVSSLRRRYDVAPPDDERVRSPRRVFDIRGLRNPFPEEAYPASRHDAPARAANEGSA